MKRFGSFTLTPKGSIGPIKKPIPVKIKGIREECYECKLLVLQNNELRDVITASEDHNKRIYQALDDTDKERMRLSDTLSSLLKRNEELINRIEELENSNLEMKHSLQEKIEQKEKQITNLDHPSGKGGAQATTKKNDTLKLPAVTTVKVPSKLVPVTTKSVYGDPKGPRSFAREGGSKAPNFLRKK